MKSLKIEIVFVAILFIFLTILIFWRFFIKGLYPFPGDFLLAWYEPWKTDNTLGQTITIPHKPIADDTFRYLYPFKTLGIDIAKKGELPLWNPYNGSGTPLLATYQWGFFNPFNTFFMFLTPQTAWSFYILTQAFLLSFFTYIYCRKIKISMKGAIFSTIVFSFSGFVIARLVFGNLIYPLTMLPFILYLLENCFENVQSKKILFLPMAVAFMLLSGHPHTMAYVLIVLVFYIIYRVLRTGAMVGKRATNLLFLTLLLAIGVGLAGTQLFPTIELLQHSNMTTTSSAFIFDRFLLPPSHLISILIPNYFGNQATYNYWGAGDYIETVAAIGIIPSFFAYFAIFTKSAIKKGHLLFFLAILIITPLATLNWFLPRFLATLPIPIISTSPPSRIFVLTAFSLAILAGFGFDNWLSPKKRAKYFFWQITPFIATIGIILIATLLLYILKISCHNEFIKECRFIALRNTILEISFFVPALFLILLINRKRISSFLIIMLVLISGLYNSNKFLPFSKSETFLPKNDLISALEKYTRDARVLGFGEANIKTDFATYFRLYDPNYFDPLYNKRYAELVAFANNGNSFFSLPRSDIEVAADATVSAALKARRDRLLNLLDVKYIIYKKSEIPKSENMNEKTIWENDLWYIKENQNALPRAYLVGRIESITDDKTLLRRMFSSSFDPHTTALIEKKPPVITDLSSSSKNKVILRDYRENNMLLEATTESNQLLVLSDNYYPGWKAFIDGQEASIYRADYTFRSIFLPKGHHLIKFFYQPLSLRIGILISIFSGFLYLLTIIFWPKISSEKNRR